MTVQAVLTSSASTSAVAGAYGTVAAGGSEATTTLRPVVTASLSGGTLRSSGGGITVVARYNRTEAGLNTGDDAHADAQTSSGGLAGGLVGVGSTTTTARADGDIDASFTGSITPVLGTTTSGLTVEVFSTNSARARSDSSSGGLYGGTNDRNEASTV